jgi:hypothetical protein
MNVANLQLEGLLMAVASLNQLLVEKGLLSAAEINNALLKAEASLINDEHFTQEISPAHRDAMCFPLRFLQLATESRINSNGPGFTELTKLVGQTKQM